MAELIPRYLDPEAYAVVLGGIVQATKLLEKRWGHSGCIRQNRGHHLMMDVVLYTGSGTVGRIVAIAAAKTLTPSTLEVGEIPAIGTEILTRCSSAGRARCSFRPTRTSRLRRGG